MFGIGDDSEDEHFLAGAPEEATVAPQFATKSGKLKWRNGYLPIDVDVQYVSDLLTNAVGQPKTLKKGTPVRIYEGELSVKQAADLLGYDKAAGPVNIPGKNGNWIIEAAPTAPNQWMFYEGADGVLITQANKSDRFSRLFAGPQDPVDLLPLSKGEDKQVTDATFNAIGKAAPAKTTAATPPPPPPKKEEGGGGLAALAIAGGLLWLLNQKGE